MQYLKLFNHSIGLKESITNPLLNTSQHSHIDNNYYPLHNNYLSPDRSLKVNYRHP